MSVTNTLVMPSAGATFVPLGGDGLSAPHAMYLVDQTLAGAAGGGSATHTFTMDSRYCSMLQWVHMAVGGSNSDQQYRIMMSSNPAGTSPRVGVTGTLVGVVSAISTEGASGFWSPPSTVMPPSAELNVTFVNVDGDTFRVSCEILLWDIRVRELAPWPYLMNASGSAGAQSFGI